MNDASSLPKTRAWWLYKVRALLISLGISVLLISLLTCALLIWLYPEWFLFEYDGGWQGLRIVMGVDLVLGPIIAFVIFSPNKARHLILLDIIIVGTIQLSAFIWGCYALWSQHPLALSYRDGAFHSITMADLKLQNATGDTLMPFSGNKPVLIYSQAPTDEEKSIAETVEMFTLNISPYTRIESFKPIKEHLADVFADQASRQQVLEKESPGTLMRFAQKHQKEISALRLVPISMRTHDAVIVMDEYANIIGGIPVSYDFATNMAVIKKKGSK
jgi:hypothetical protein